MRIRLISIFSFLLIFSQILNSQNSFTANLKVPPEIIQGKSVIIVLDIYKPKGLKNFTTYTQNIPKGFYFKEIDLAGASSTIENNELTLTWLRIPEAEKISVRYELSAMVGLSGKYSLSGSLTYLINNKQGKFNLKDYYISVVEKKKEIVKIEDNVGNIPIYNNSVVLKDVKCSRVITYNKRKNSYSVEIIIKKKKKGAYSIVEKLPKNFEFAETESLGAKLNNTNSLVQYIWKKVPSSKEMRVTYELIPGKNISIKPVITGKLSILSKGRIFNLPILTVSN